MSFGVLGDLNWLAVIVATIAYFALGGLWFTRLTFGTIWQRSVGWEPAEGEGAGAAMYAGPLIGALVAVTALGMVAEAAGADGFGDGIVLGLVVGAGIVGAILFVTGVFEPTKPKPMTWFAVTAGYHLVGLLIAAVILSLW